MAGLYSRPAACEFGSPDGRVLARPPGGRRATAQPCGFCTRMGVLQLERCASATGEGRTRKKDHRERCTSRHDASIEASEPVDRSA